MLIAFLFLYSSCNTPTTTVLSVATASSLTSAMSDIIEEFEQLNPAIEVRLIMGGSGALSRQIVNGAPVDVFISASEKYISHLQITKSAPFLSNQLVVVIPINSPLTTIDELWSDQNLTLAVGQFNAAPIGDYAQAWLSNIHKLDNVSNQLIFLKNAQQVLTAIENGHADVGIVYKTDLTGSMKVKLLHSPSSKLYPEITYFAVIPASSTKQTLALSFFDYLQSTEATQTWLKHNFTSLTIY